LAAPSPHGQAAQPAKIDQARLRAATVDTNYPRIVRTIGDDKALVDELIHELTLRGKWHDGPRKSVVLVAEQDTLYGRTFPIMFKKQAKNASVRTFSFFRGVDGALPGDLPVTTESELRALVQHEDRAPGDHDGDQEPRPTGRAQSDYLRRLEAELVELDKTERAAGGDGISAIGVVSTDLYDKLLFLRALRRKFPNAIFFTTDFDAEIAHPSEQLSTRNVVVASHFGLQLHRKLQGDVPPFRDSSQTSTFFAALLALDAPVLASFPEAVKTNPWGQGQPLSGVEYLQPLTFEIGLDGPYQMTIPHGPYAADGTQQIQPDSPRSSSWLTWRRALLAAAATLLLVVCFAVCVAWIRRMLTGGNVSDWRAFHRALIKQALPLLLTVVAVPVSLIGIDNRRADGEPFSLHQGISLWPTTLIQYLAAVSAVTLLLASRADLRKSREQLEGWSKPARSRRASASEPTLWELVKQRQWGRAWAFAWEHVFIFNWSADVDPQSPASAHELCAQYVQRSALSYRLMRVLPLGLAFVGFAACLFGIVGRPSRPYRGNVADWSSVVVIFCASVALIFLTFFVIDATQLCRRFIRALVDAEADWKNPASIALVKQRLPPRSPKEERFVRELFTVRVIAECSHVVGKLILYPFIVVFLLFMARSPVFDYLAIGGALATVWALLLIGSASASVAMRIAAQNTRQAILSRLRDALAARVGTPPGERLTQTIADIEDESRGAFRHWASDPMFSAMAILFGGGGTLIAIEQLFPWIFM